MCDQSSSRETLIINIGQSGVQISNSIWELLCLEHGILANGDVPEAMEDVTYHPLFHETISKKYVPRSLQIDLEPTVIDEVRTGMYRDLFHPDQMISSNEDSGNNFARGHFTKGKEIIKKILNNVRKMVERSSHFQSFYLNHSYGGGTGSGLTSLLLDKLNQEYGKKSRFSIGVFPSPMMSTAIVEPYNSVLFNHSAVDCTDVAIVFDNEALYELCGKGLSMCNPSYTAANRLIAQIFSSLTSSLRFENSIYNDTETLMTNLIPYPRIHFPICNYSPVVSVDRALHTGLSIAEITRELFESTSQTLTCDPTQGKYMACSIQFKGYVNATSVHETIRDMKSSDLLPFVDWCPTGFKIGINAIIPTMVPNSNMAPIETNATLVTNTTAICGVFKKLIRKFDLLFSKRAMVHHFVGEGMEEGEFVEAKDDYNRLILDYEEAALPSGGDDNNNLSPPMTRKESNRSEERMDEFKKQQSESYSPEKSAKSRASISSNIGPSSSFKEEYEY